MATEYKFDFNCFNFLDMTKENKDLFKYDNRINEVTVSVYGTDLNTAEEEVANIIGKRDIIEVVFIEEIRDKV